MYNNGNLIKIKNKAELKGSVLMQHSTSCMVTSPYKCRVGHIEN